MFPCTMGQEVNAGDGFGYRTLFLLANSEGEPGIVGRDLRRQLRVGEAIVPDELERVGAPSSACRSRSGSFWPGAGLCPT